MGRPALDIEYGALRSMQAYVEAMPDAAITAARIALNDVSASEGLTVIRSEVAKGANFPPGYLNDQRLGITRRATNKDLAVEITGRFRATSLARFIVGTPSRKEGLRVQVKPGGPTARLKSGFVINLKRNGGDGFNQGLAIRLKPGERLRASTGAKAIGLDKNLYLLYGPSIDQIFREVGPQEAPAILEKVEAEFYRQFFRLVGRVK